MNRPLEKYPDAEVEVAKAVAGKYKAIGYFRVLALRLLGTKVIPARFTEIYVGNHTGCPNHDYIAAKVELESLPPFFLEFPCPYNGNLPYPEKIVLRPGDLYLNEAGERVFLPIAINLKYCKKWPKISVSVGVDPV